MSDHVPPIKTLRPHQLGWLKRPDLGKSIWEKPNGELYEHDKDSEPVLEFATGIRVLKSNTSR